MLPAPAKGLEGPEPPLWTETLPLGGEDLSPACFALTHPAHKPKTLFEGSPLRVYVFPSEGSSLTFGHSLRMDDQCAVCSDTHQTHGRLIPPPVAHSAQELLQAHTQKAAKTQGTPWDKRTAESKGAPQNYV